MLIANNGNNVESKESSNSDSLNSLSEQVAILEERLADCKSLINSLIYFDFLFNLMICQVHVRWHLSTTKSRRAHSQNCARPIFPSFLATTRTDRHFLQVQSIKKETRFERPTSIPFIIPHHHIKPLPCDCFYSKVFYWKI